MKIQTTTFTCDVSRCKAQTTVFAGQGEPVSAYLDLVAGGWQVHRGITGWKHVCPEHEVGDLK